VSQWAVWLIVALGVAGVIFHPFGMKEGYPALAGAAALVAFGLLPPRAALAGVGQGVDVYLFLTGMMLLSELAASQGLFGWAAAFTARAAAGSAHRLFLLIYAMAVLITMFLSNDATAVVFTPAVAAMARAVKAENPLPYLLICAFVANAASFVLPISNPANLVVFGAKLPHLLPWLRQFLLPACIAIFATFVLLRFSQRAALRQAIEIPAERPVLSTGARRTGVGLIFTALLLMGASGFGFSLGLPTFLASILTLAIVRANPWPLLKHISWSVLPLVAGLFVMVAALDRAGTAVALGGLLQQVPPWAAGLGLGLATNLVNNLPAGLLAGHALAHAPAATTAAALIGVDLGPNLSVTGSLATILWLTALRREGVQVTAWQFLRLGAVVMPPALLLALIVK